VDDVNEHLECLGKLKKMLPKPAISSLQISADLG